MPSVLRWACIVIFFVATIARAEVVISEFVAENDDGLTDVDGETSDWIELFNNGASGVNLAGWHLTDDASKPQKWPLPNLTLAVGERKVIFASGKDRRDPLAELHTNFSLQNGGGYLALRNSGGTVTSQWNPYPGQRSDISFGDGTLVDRQDLVTATSGGKYFVPTSGTLGNTWQSAGFDDASWTAGSARLGYQTGVAPPGLPISYWSFDDTTANTVPGGPALTGVGTTYEPSIPPAIGDGKALHFSSVGNTYATTQLDVSETSYTVSFWFRTSTPTVGLYAVHLGLMGANGHDRHVYLTNGNIGVRIHSTETLVTTDKFYSDGQWHHVAHVFGGSVGGQKLFVDGVQVLSGNKNVSNFTTQDRITVGFSNDATGGQYLDGDIDDLAIWSEALSPQSIQSLAAGADPMQLTVFTAYISTDVGAAMKGVNASIYARYPFTVNRQTPLNSATLRVRYDDGFVAYLDGTEIARRMAPAGQVFNSVAELDRSPAEAVMVEEIDVSAFAHLLTNGNHVLAIQGLNEAANSNEFLLNADLSAANLSQATGIYMDPPTPGAENNTGFGGFVADTVFNPKRGFYDTPQQVVISCATPGATIAYTTDGSDPSPTNGTQVPAASAVVPPSVTIPVTGNTILRTMAYRNGLGMRSTNIDAATYLFVNQIAAQSNTQPGFNPQWNGRVADYGMDQGVVNTPLPGYGIREALLSLPSVSLTCKTGDLFDAPLGIYYNTSQRGLPSERKASIEWINPNGTPGWHVQAGVRLHGNSSRSHSFTPKHPLRLKFRKEYGAGKFEKDDLFTPGGADKFDELVLRGCSTDSFPVGDGTYFDDEQRWNNDKATYLRDQFVRDTLNDLGSPNCRGRYCHLFINGLYWGLYNISERPTAEFFAETFGGKSEEWDVLKDIQELNDGTLAVWNEMMTLVNSGLDADDNMQRLFGNNPDGTRNPAYPIYLHRDSFIDYMIVHIASGAEDWANHNYWAGRRRGEASDGFRFVAWDQEISNDSLTRKSGWNTPKTFEEVDDAGPCRIYDRLRRNTTFQRIFRERVHQLLLNNGPFSPAANKARWAVRQAEIDKAMVAESARWGDGSGETVKRRETTWLAAMAFMNTPGSGYFDAILPIQVQRFRNVGLYPYVDQPAFSRPGGSVNSGTKIFLKSDQPGIYYTTDGTDPMGPDGSPSATAVLYMAGGEPTQPIPKGGLWRYLVTNSAPPSAWKDNGFNDTGWTQGFAQLGYGDGDETTVISDGGNPASRNITTYFRKKFNLSTPAISAQLKLLRDDGAVVYLNGKEVFRSNMHPTNPVTWSSKASTNASGADESTYFYEKALSAADFIVGENVLAVELHQVSATSDDLSFDAELNVVTASPSAGVELLNTSTVKMRALSSIGEWSGLNSATYIVDSTPANASNVVISEIHYHPADPTTPAELAASIDPEDYEFIELMNISETTVDMSEIEFTAGIDFHFFTGFILMPGERCAVVKNQNAFAARYGQFRYVAGTFENGTGLNNSGELLKLERVSGGVATTLKSFAYDDVAPWPVTPDGNGPSLVLLNPASNPDPSMGSNWVASADPGGTPAQMSMTTTFGAWSALTRESQSGSTDEDRDGISNTLEFALALDPQSQNSSALPAPQVVRVDGQEFLSITFRHRESSDSLLVIVESSENLAVWSSSNVVLMNSIDHGDGTVTETWRTKEPTSSAAPQFLRARAIVPGN